MHRAIALALVWTAAAASSAEALNDTVSTPLQAIVGERRAQTLASGQVGYYRYFLAFQRSYVAFCWPPQLEGTPPVNGECSVSFTDANGNAVGFLVVSEPYLPAGSAAGVGDGEAALVRIANTTAGPLTMNLIVMETTLVAPSYYVNRPSGYDSYVQVRNHSWASSTLVTVRAYNASGNLIGSQSTLLAPNASTIVRVGADLGVADGSGSITITHTGMPSIVVANVTTLSTLLGLSFDAPCEPRMVWSIFGSS